MPNLLIRIPHGAFPGAARDVLFRTVTNVASDVEQVGNDPRNQAAIWVAIEELPRGAIRAGGADISQRVLQCLVQAYVPAGVLDGASRAAYVARLSAAFQGAMPAGDARHVALSTLLLEMPEGQWGAGDRIWRLPDVASAAGFRHLQSVALPAEGAGQ